ncbi:MAG: insulinase family protein [Opitutaceae bacterium]|nr:insulinase family protein [Opitutaceae bacterium]
MAEKKSSADLALLRRFWQELVVRRVLPNGLTVLVKPDHKAAVASVQVWVKTGSIHEGRDLGAGLSHYLEHMLFKGTSRRTGRQISAEVQGHGGYHNAYTTFDRTVYYIDLPAEHIAMAVDVLADMVLHSTLDAGEAKKEKDVILREIDMGQDDPDQRLAHTLFATAFRQHPYAHPIIGHREIFAQITRRQLLDYYQTRYVPNNLVVVVCGDVDPEQTVQTINQRFGAAPRRALAPVLVPDEPAQLSARAVHEAGDFELSRAGLGWQIPGLTHPDAPALDVLAMVLGAGDSSLLWQEIREKKGLVHTIEASSWNPGTSGLFFVSFTTDPDKRVRATDAIRAVLERAKRTGFKSAQLRKAVRQLVVGEINTRKTMSGQASRLGVAETVVGDLDFSRAYFERVAALTVEDLRRVLARYVVPEHCTAVSLNPKPTSAAVTPESSAARARPEFSEIKLPNGARLLLQRDDALPNVHLRLCALGGALFEPTDRRGISSLLATMMTKDTKRRSAAQVARLIDAVGGSMQPMVGNNSVGLSVEVLPADLPLGFGLLADAVLNPAFRPGTLALEREAQLAALRDDHDNVVSHGLRLLRRRFFGEHPLAVGAHGEEADVSKVSPRDLAALHQDVFRSENVVLVVAGDFDPPQLEKSARRLLLALPRGAVSRRAATFTGPAQPGDTEERQPRQQAVVFEAYPAPAIGDELFHVSEVMDELFSGMSSRLFERVRDELGLAYYVRSERVVGLDAAMFYFYAGTAPGKERAIYKEITAEIRRVMSGGVGADELARCQTRLKAGHRMGMQTNSARAAQAALNVLYGKPANDARDYERRIDAVTREDLRDFARRYFKPAWRTRLTVRP